MSKHRILVVDDEPSLLLTLQWAFEETPHEVLTAATAEIAVGMLRRESVDLLLVDKNLPGMSGLDLIRLVRTENAGVPIILMTAFGSEQSAQESLNFGINAYLEKPFPDIHALVDRVSDLLTKGDRRWLPDPGVFSPMRTGESQRPVDPRAAPIAVLVATREEDATRIVALLERCPVRCFLVSQTEMLLGSVKRFVPDLVVFDGSDLPDCGISTLTEIRAIAPNVTFAVIANGVPPLAILKQMIDLGVGRLLENSFDEQFGRRLAELVDAIRLR